MSLKTCYVQGLSKQGDVDLPGSNPFKKEITDAATIRN